MDGNGDVFGAFTNGVFEAAASAGAFASQSLNPVYATLLASDAAGDLVGYFQYGNGVCTYTAGAAAFSSTALTTIAPSAVAGDALGDVFVDFTAGYYRFTVANGLLLAPGTEGDASLAV